MPKFKLFDLMLDRVDLCGAGANPDASIMLFKSKEEPVPQKKKKPAAKTAKGKADSRSKAKQRGDEEEEEEEEEEAVAKAEDDDEDEDLADDDADVDEEEEEDDEPPARKKTKKAEKKPAKKVAKADDDQEEEDDDIADEDDDAFDDEDLPESVLKSLPRAARVAIERTQRIAKQAREMAQTEKSRRERLEFIAKAKKEIPNLTGTEEEKGELMQALYSGTVTKKQADSIVKMLKAADAAQRSLLMSERGSGRARTDDEDNALAEIDTRVQELMSKDTKLTKSQARVKVCQDDPALYERYKMEKRRSDAN